MKEFTVVIHAGGLTHRVPVEATNADEAEKQIRQKDQYQWTRDDGKSVFKVPLHQVVCVEVHENAASPRKLGFRPQ